MLQREPDIIRVTVGKHKAQTPLPPAVTLEDLAQEIESLKNRLAKVEEKQAKKEGDPRGV
ncbi:MAG TPA: 3-deoxy-7-phosphoheptulonate synthase [Firmicutes bacterium]|nr:3-deoxy-7-phosphoheptulonate synthase [Candidatus Fermentithermobacillaceae bacterium]